MGNSKSLTHCRVEAEGAAGGGPKREGRRGYVKGEENEGEGASAQ